MVCGPIGPSAVSSAAPAQRPAQAPCLHIVPLRGWHLPLLQDPCFADLLPLLQRAVLLQAPERLLNSLTARPPLVPDVLLAYREPQHPLGLLLSQRLNRSGSCWQLLQLRSSEASLAAGEAGRMAIEAALIREAIQRSRGAASWIATAATTDSDRLALLRQQMGPHYDLNALWEGHRACEFDVRDADATIEQISVDEKDPFTSIVDVVLTVRDRIHLADILRRARGLKQVRRIYRVKN